MTNFDQDFACFSCWDPLEKVSVYIFYHTENRLQTTGKNGNSTAPELTAPHTHLKLLLVHGKSRMACFTLVRFLKPSVSNAAASWCLAAVNQMPITSYWGNLVKLAGHFRKIFLISQSQILYEPSGPWGRRLSPVSVVLSGWESLTPPGWDTNTSQVSSQQTLVLIYLPRKDGKLSWLRRKRRLHKYSNLDKPGNRTGDLVVGTRLL